MEEEKPTSYHQEIFWVVLIIIVIFFVWMYSGFSTGSIKSDKVMKTTKTGLSK